MNNETVTIVLPLPSGLLSPNRIHSSRGGRMARWRISQKCKALAKKTTLECQVETAPWEKANIYYAFFHKQDRRRDDTNHNQMCKSYLDGIVEAGLIVDDDHKHLTTQPTKFSIDKDNPRVEIRLERLV